MRTMQQWFDEYAVSHQNPTNKAIHYLCVPLIFFSIVGLLMSIPSGFLSTWLGFEAPLLLNWAVIVLIPVLIFYLRLSPTMAFKVFLFAALCVVINYYVGLLMPLWLFALSVFALAWIGQFYGHNIEGAKPSFLKDIQFLMIGPAWVLDHLFPGKERSKGLR